jgi:hypothetical protein
MRLILSMILAVAVTAGAAYAGCGKKVTNEGTFKTLDADKKVIVVASEGGEETKLTLTMNTKAVGADGKDADLADLVGEEVTVISEHSKVDSVTLAKK